MYLKLAAMTLMAAAPAQAGQPISESLVDCAALITLSNRAQPHRADYGKGYALDRASKRLLTAARNRAAQEGRTDPQAYVAGLVPIKEEKWDAKGLRYVMTQDFRDWMQYCVSLSDHLGIELKD